MKHKNLPLWVVVQNYTTEELIKKAEGLEFIYNCILMVVFGVMLFVGVGAPKLTSEELPSNLLSLIGAIAVSVFVSFPLARRYRALRNELNRQALAFPYVNFGRGIFPNGGAFNPSSGAGVTERAEDDSEGVDDLFGDSVPAEAELEEADELFSDSKS